MGTKTSAVTISDAALDQIMNAIEVLVSLKRNGSLPWAALDFTELADNPALADEVELALSGFIEIIGDPELKASAEKALEELIVAGLQSHAKSRGYWGVFSKIDEDSSPVKADTGPEYDRPEEWDFQPSASVGYVGKVVQDAALADDGVLLNAAAMRENARKAMGRRAVEASKPDLNAVRDAFKEKNEDSSSATGPISIKIRTVTIAGLTADDVSQLDFDQD